MILTIDDWKFQIYSVATRKYYARELAEHCTCATCRNFYTAVDQTYPELRGFLRKFGVEVEAPDEMMAYTPTLCANYYAVCGTILERGQGSIQVGDTLVTPMTQEEAMANTWLSEPLFFLSVDTMRLPWVLKEPPAEGPSGEKDTVSRILGRWITESE